MTYGLPTNILLFEETQIWVNNKLPEALPMLAGAVVGILANSRASLFVFQGQRKHVTFSLIYDIFYDFKFLLLPLICQMIFS